MASDWLNVRHIEWSCFFNYLMRKELFTVTWNSSKWAQVKGGVNPPTLSEPAIFVLFIILSVNVYIFITDINHLPKANFSRIIC